MLILSVAVLSNWVTKKISFGISYLSNFSNSDFGNSNSDPSSTKITFWPSKASGIPVIKKGTVKCVAILASIY